MKRMYILFLLASFLFSYCLQAQQWGVAYVPRARNINSVVILSPTAIVSAGGNDYNDSLQQLLRTNDYGTDWFEDTGDCICSVVKSLGFSDTLHGFAVGYNGKIVRTADGGYTWRYGSSPINRNFWKIVFTDSLHAVIAGGEETGPSRQSVLTTADGGNTWAVAYDTTGPALKSMCFINTQKGFAVGDSGVILSTINGGLNWAPVTTPIQRDFTSIAFINGDTGFIVGGQRYNDSVRTILHTVDGGITWSVLTDLPGGIFADVYFRDSQHGYIAGDRATLWVSNDGGNTWAADTIKSAMGNEYFTTVRYYDSTFAVIGSLEGEMFIYDSVPAPSVKTGYVIFEPQNSISLSATFNTHNFPASAIFFYTTDSAIVSYSQTFAVTVNSVSTDSTIQQINSNIISPGAWYFTCQLTNLAGTFYSDTVKFVVPATPPVLTPGYPTNIGSVSASLQGTVNKLPVSSAVYFEYSVQGDTAVYTAPAIPALISDTMAHQVSAGISGLVPFINYQFRIKAVHNNEIFYSDYLQFHTGIALVEVITLNAANISATSATLEGEVNHLPVASTLWFEYTMIGDTTVHTIAAIPAAINDSLPHFDSVRLSGLAPYSVYQFRQKVVLASLTTLYGIWNPIYTGGTILAVTDSATGITDTSATLNGHVQNVPPGSQVQFLCWYGGNAPIVVKPASSLVSDTLAHSFSVHIGGLIPYTPYNCYLQVVDTPVTWQSNTVLFYTGSGSPFLLETDAATSVTGTSAVLNGRAENLPFPSSVYFDYWLPGQAHVSIAANPDSISDTLMHLISAPLTGLAPGNSYYYCLKIVDSLATRYADSTTIFTGGNTIPNFDFENWTAVGGEKPDGWINIFGPVSRVSPGATGNYAVKLQASPAGVCALLNGYIGDGHGEGQVIEGGIPYNARPDTFTGMFKYDINPGDTADILLLFKSGGQVITQNMLTFTGSSPDSFRQLKFPITFTSPATPDTLVMGIVPTNINITAITSSWVIADDLSFTPAFPPIANGDFENWQSYSFKKLDVWGYSSMDDEGFYSNPDSECAMQTTDAEHGLYAAELANVPFMGQYINGNIATLINKNVGSGASFPVNHKVQTLSGYYQFYPQNGDTFLVQCDVFNQGSNIGTGQFWTTGAASAYTEFNLNINYYNNAVVPDSATINVQPCYGYPYGASRARVDNLSFDGFAVGIKDIQNSTSQTTASDLKIFPNPANNNLQIEYIHQTAGNLNFRLLDMDGRTLYENEGNYPAGVVKNQFDIAGLSAGIYLVSVGSEDAVITRKLVVQR